MENNNNAISLVIRNRRVGAFLLAFILVITLCFLPILPLSLVVYSDDEIIYEKAVNAEYFEVSFHHSVNKGHIREIYKIDKNSKLFTLHRGFFQSYGAGMIDIVHETNGLNFRQEDDYFVLDFPEEWRESVGYVVGNIANHVFVYDEDVINIGEQYSQTQVTFALVKKSVAEKILALL